MATGGSGQGIGGYDCHFIEDPPDELVCQICTLVALHPHQVSCCGRVFCKVCLEEYKRHTQCEFSKFQCPNCRKRTSSFHDRRGSRNIKFLKVQCNNEEYGCAWDGELLYLQDHLKECPFMKLSCPNRCTESIFRVELQTHIEKECLLRRYTCPDCSACSTYEHIATKHKTECPEVVISCPNECGCTAVVRRLIGSHLAICPNQRVSCAYAEVGCKEKFLRKDIPKHQSENTQHHLEMAMKAVVQQKRPIAVFKMSNFTHHKSINKWWYSPGFYTHPGGYKFCLGVTANGNSDGARTHVSVYIYRLKGENDDNLIWPFRGCVTFELLNQLKDAEHFSGSVPFDFHGCNEFNSRVLKGDRSTQGWGFNRFIPHDALSYNKSSLVFYLKDDSLYFRVVAIEVYATNKPWLSCTNN